MRKDLDYFKLFGLNKHSVLADVGKIYKRQALLYHPDKGQPESETKESNLVIKIFFTALDKDEIAAIKAAECIVFEFRRGQWFLHAYWTFFDMFTEPFTYFEKRIERESDLASLKKITAELRKPGQHKIIVEKDEARITLRDISRQQGRVTLAEAGTEKFKWLSSLKERLSNRSVFDFYKTIEIQCSRLVGQSVDSKILVLSIINEDLVKFLSRLCSDTNEYLNPSFHLLIQKSVEFIFRFSCYLLSNEVVKNNKHDFLELSGFAYQALKLFNQTYKKSLEEKISLQDFPRGAFLLSTFLDAMTDNAVYSIKVR